VLALLLLVLALLLLGLLLVLLVLVLLLLRLLLRRGRYRRRRSSRCTRLPTLASRPTWPLGRPLRLRGGSSAAGASSARADAELR